MTKTASFAMAALLIAAACTDPLEPELSIDPLVFGIYDEDHNDQLTATEFHDGVYLDDWFGDLDSNDDLVLGNDEFDDDIGDFEDFDTSGDGGVETGEFIDGLFAAFDTDDDSMVSESEFEVGVAILN